MPLFVIDKNLYSEKWTLSIQIIADWKNVIRRPITEFEISFEVNYQLSEGPCITRTRFGIILRQTGIAWEQISLFSIRSKIYDTLCVPIVCQLSQSNKSPTNSIHTNFDKNLKWIYLGKLT